MNDNLERIRERIASRSNEELLQMVKVDSSQYRQEALDMAMAEIKKRGLSLLSEGTEEEEEVEGRLLDSMSIDEKLAYVIKRLNELEDRLPDSDIISQKFWKRAWAVFGYNLATGALIYGCLIALALIIGVLSGIGR